MTPKTNTATHPATLALSAAFFTVGIFGRFPWKADEPYTLGIIWGMLEKRSWIVPHVVDQPFVEKPPLIYWLGAASAWLADHFPPHEASRLAIVGLVAATLLAIWSTASLLWAEAQRWRECHLGTRAPDRRTGRLEYAATALLMFAGSVGVAEHIHKLTADLGQLAGAAVALWGLVRLYAKRPVPEPVEPRRAAVSGAWVGTGIGIAFLSKGLLIPGLVAITWIACAVALHGQPVDARRAVRVAVVAALPWIVVWPALLWRDSPDLFDEWLWANNIGRFLGEGKLGATGTPCTRKVASIAWMAFPVLPLAVATVATTWRRAASLRPSWQVLRDAPGHVCLAAFSIFAVAVLVASGTYRDSYVLPALFGLALLGLPALPATEHGAMQRWVRTAVTLLFAGAAIGVVAVWAQLVLAGTLRPAAIAEAVGRVLPVPFRLAFDPLSVAPAGLAVALWICAVRDRRRGWVESWCAGVAMLWILSLSLLLPWIDAARSYEATFVDLRRQLGAADCLYALGFGESEAAMLEYVTRADVRTLRGDAPEAGSGRTCRWLVEFRRQPDAPVERRAGGWRFVWAGHRPADPRERFWLYRRDGMPAEPAMAP